MPDREIKESIVKMRYGMEIGYGQEIIRCKDCEKHYNELKCRCGGYTPDDWFCAGGTAKKDV